MIPRSFLQASTDGGGSRLQRAERSPGLTISMYKASERRCSFFNRRGGSYAMDAQYIGGGGAREIHIKVRLA